MSKKGVVNYIDIRVREGFSLRNDICRYINSELELLENDFGEFEAGSSDLSFSMDASVVDFRIESLFSDLGFCVSVGLLRERTFDKLCDLLFSYCIRYDEICRERGLDQ